MVAEPSVLDASAVLAFLRRERGFQRVLAAMPGATISTVNLSEVQAKVLESGLEPDAVTERLRAVGLDVEPFVEEDAAAAASLYPGSRPLGLSLADRACLAQALRLGRTVLTADRVLARTDVAVAVSTIR